MEDIPIRKPTHERPMAAPLIDPPKQPCQAHPEVETRLTCTECGAPICPKCMVMYEAGFKCPGCAKKRVSHAAKVSGGQAVTLGFFSLLAGYAYGWVHPWLQLLGFFRIFGMPVLLFVTAYWLGRGAGELIQRRVHYKYGLRLAVGTAGACLLGLFYSPPLHAAVLDILTVLSSGSGSEYSTGTSSAFYLMQQGLPLLGAVFFLRGLSRKFQAP